MSLSVLISGLIYNVASTSITGTICQWRTTILPQSVVHRFYYTKLTRRLSTNPILSFIWAACLYCTHRYSLIVHRWSPMGLLGTSMPSVLNSLAYTCRNHPFLDQYPRHSHAHISHSSLYDAELGQETSTCLSDFTCELVFLDCLIWHTHNLY